MGVIEESFINWLDSRLDEITGQFGCIERKTWVFIDGIRGDYEKERWTGVRKYLNEAFWPDQRHADQFRQWLMSEDGKSSGALVRIRCQPHGPALRRCPRDHAGH
jgi:hypothetical protein